MPSSQVNIAPAGIHVAGTGLISCEKGALVAVSIFPDRGGIGPFEAYADIWLISTETPNPIPIIILVAGGIGVLDGISWTGRLPAEPHLAVRGRVWTNNATVTYRLSVMTEID